MNYKQIVYLSSIPWTYSWHRQQEMMSKFAELGYRILFVEPVDKINPLKRSLKHISKNIWILSVSGLPFERCLPIINSINGYVSRRQILKAVDNLEFGNYIVWFDRVHGTDYKYFFENRKIVYDLIDEITAFGRFHNDRLLLSVENRVLQQADLLISSSQTLLQRKLDQSGRSEKKKNLFVPNGLDIKRFMNVTKQWEDINSLRHPIIGFVGDVSMRRINFGLIKTISARHPEWNFVFIGPHRKEEIQNVQAGNIVFFPPVANDMIPSVIKSFDVGIIPYNIENKDMDYIFPRKACEYLACGKPVVSTPLNELKFFGSMCIVAHDTEAFEQGIIDALKLNDSEKRIEYVSSFDWSYYIPKIISCL